jgi:hypothetical protein
VLVCFQTISHFLLHYRLTQRNSGVYYLHSEPCRLSYRLWSLACRHAERLWRHHMICGEHYSPAVPVFLGGMLVSIDWGHFTCSCMYAHWFVFLYVDNWCVIHNGFEDSNLVRPCCLHWYVEMFLTSSFPPPPPTAKYKKSNFLEVDGLGSEDGESKLREASVNFIQSHTSCRKGLNVGHVVLCSEWTWDFSSIDNRF